MTTQSWKEFWNSEQKLYVSPRHMQFYYEKLGRDIKSLLPKRRPLTFLDYGCGDAWAAGELVQDGIHVFLYDPTPNVQMRIKDRWGNTPGITIVSQFNEVPTGSMDVIFMYSVLQYMSKDDALKLFQSFSRVLKPYGVLFIGDVILPSTSMVQDVRALLGAGIRGGFFFDAVKGLVETFFSDYRVLRKKAGFSIYSQKEIGDMLRKSGYIPAFLPNIGLSSSRMLVRAERNS